MKIIGKVIGGSFEEKTRTYKDSMANFHWVGANLNMGQAYSECANELLI